MGSDTNVDIFQKETIRPSSPTPHHRKVTTISVFDQLIPDIYVPILLFFPNNNIDPYRSSIAERSKLLKASLSETLAHFYPFAGEFEFNHSISCNDHGAAFLAAQVNCPISKILNKPDFGLLRKLLPAQMGSREVDPSCYLLQVQANFFECGGMAIGVCITHKIADGSTIDKFISTWAAIAFASANPTHYVALPAPDFGAGASLFPPLGFLNSPLPVLEFAKEKWVTRRIVFDASKIAALQSKAVIRTLKKPTRVEVVSALIWKCAMEASRSNSGVTKPSAWFPFVNMRKILLDRSAENLLGNFFAVFEANTKVSKVDDGIGDFQRLVCKLRKGINEFRLKYIKGVCGEDACEFFSDYGSRMDRDDVDSYSCSSWCRFPFYGVDFGWGKPWWVTQCMEFKNMIVLTDTRDGDGIEASLTLNEEVMAIFESNKELLAYASLNPAVI